MFLYYGKVKKYMFSYLTASPNLLKQKLTLSIFSLTHRRNVQNFLLEHQTASSYIAEIVVPHGSSPPPLGVRPKSGSPITKVCMNLKNGHYSNSNCFKAV